jgi:hypothetical protein
LLPVLCSAEAGTCRKSCNSVHCTLTRGEAGTLSLIVRSHPYRHDCVHTHHLPLARCAYACAHSYYYSIILVDIISDHPRGSLITSQHGLYVRVALFDAHRACVHSSRSFPLRMRSSHLHRHFKPIFSAARSMFVCVHVHLNQHCHSEVASLLLVIRVSCHSPSHCLRVLITCLSILRLSYS